MKIMKKILIAIGIIILIVIIAGIYKFNYLANQPGYDVDGNKISTETSQFNAEKSAKKGVPTTIKSISPQEFKKLASSGEYTIIDVRTPDEFTNEPLFTDALNIDYYKPDFRENLAKLDPDEAYLIYCRSGSRSGKTLKIMRDLGFKNVADLAGGRKAWLMTFPINIEKKVIESKKEEEIPAKKGISLSEVTKHNSRNDCWTAINGKVYDVTAFFGVHPGGDENLFRVCGIDATAIFNAQHKYQNNAKNKLEEFYIDDLQK